MSKSLFFKVISWNAYHEKENKQIQELIAFSNKIAIL